MYIDPEGTEKSKAPEGYGPSGGKDHKKGKRKSTKGKHEKGGAAKDKSRGRERGDNNRRPPRKKPDSYKKGPWPPKIPGLPPFFNPCIFFHGCDKDGKIILDPWDVDGVTPFKSSTDNNSCSMKY